MVIVYVDWCVALNTNSNLLVSQGIQCVPVIHKNAERNKWFLVLLLDI